MRYLLIFTVFLGTLVACSKKQDDTVADTRFTYTNTIADTIDIHLYRKALNTISFKYTVLPYDSLSLDFRSISGPASPFGAPEVDSAEVVFNGGKRIIYTIFGINGSDKPRNIFYTTTSGTGYVRTLSGPRNYQYNYTFTQTDRNNAK